MEGQLWLAAREIVAGMAGVDLVELALKHDSL
jgi:hypothetical protein